MENGSRGRKNVGEGEFFPSALIKDYFRISKDQIHKDV